MRTIVYERYGPPEVLRVEEAPTPVPGENEVLIRVRAVAVTSADSMMRKVDQFIVRLFMGLMKPRVRVLGTEFAGVIEAVGEKVTKWKAGDEIYGATGEHFGAYAEYLCLPEDGAIDLKPENHTFEEAAAFAEGMLTALPFIRDMAKAGPGRRILINGAAGSVGTSAVQIAKHYGADVTGVCGPKNLDLVRSLGAERVIDYTKEDFTRLGETWDVVFDAVGKRSFGECKGALNKGGAYLTTVLKFRVLAQMLWTSKFSDKKVLFSATGLRKPAGKVPDLVFLKEVAERENLKPVIDGVYTMEEIAEAHRHVETGHKRGQVVVTAVGSLEERRTADGNDSRR